MSDLSPRDPVCAVALGAELHELDLRWLPCPEPMQRALAAADALAAGQVVQLLTPLLPTPLLEVLTARGLQTRVFMLPSGGARLLIRRPGHDDTAGA